MSIYVQNFGNYAPNSENNTIYNATEFIPYSIEKESFDLYEYQLEVDDECGQQTQGGGDIVCSDDDSIFFEVVGDDWAHIFLVA